PRTRYLAGGGMRAAGMYGGAGPCAIEVAPIGRNADYDLNLLDTAAALYTQDSSYVRVTLASGVMNLELVQSDGTTATIVTIVATALTLQNLVDTINATSFAVNAMQFRAQLAPGALPDAQC